MKDTGRDIQDTREFVVNLASEAIAEAMNMTCIDAPAEVDEMPLARLAPAPLVKVAPPRRAASPWHWNVNSSSGFHSAPTSSLPSAASSVPTSPIESCSMPTPIRSTRPA